MELLCVEAFFSWDLRDPMDFRRRNKAAQTHTHTHEHSCSIEIRCSITAVVTHLCILSKASSKAAKASWRETPVSIRIVITMAP